MHRHRLLLRTLLLAPLVSGCAGHVVEGTGEAGTSGGDSDGTGSSGEAPTTMSPTTTPPTSAGPSSDPSASDPSASDPSASDPTTGPVDTTGAVTATDTGEPGTTTTTGDPVCGDGVPEADELCDDGNDDQADGCTTLCRAPKNCLELLMLAPDTPNEAYDIDPESDGSVLHLYCDMTGGGWTQVYYDEFNDKNGWSAGDISDCGELGKILGGVGQFGYKTSTQKQVGLQNVAHTQLRLIVELAIIDSWDDETIFADVDDQEVAKRSCKHYDPNTCGQTKNQCGGGWNDGNTTIAGDRDHAVDTAVVKIHADLSEDANNESWGLDTLYVFVK